jgi:hypothetical protein
VETTSRFPRRRRARAGALAPFLLLVVVLGCGGDGPPGPPPPAAPAPSPAADPRRLSDAEVAGATFVDLDLARFPPLPPAAVPKEGVVHVATTGDDERGTGSATAPFRSIARGVQAAAPGQTVLVGGGEYAEGTDHRALVIGIPGLVLRGVPGERVRVVPASAEVTYGIEVAADGVQLRDLELEGFGTIGVLSAGPGVRRDLVLVGLTIRGSGEGVATWEGAIDGLLAHDVAIEGATGIGFHCGEGAGRNWRLEHVKIRMQGEGEGSGADAFALEHGDNVLLVDVEATGASADGIDTKASRVVVFGCHVHHVGRNGIKLWEGGDVIDTLVHHTGADAAIVVHDGPRARLLHCVVAYHNHGAGSSYNMTFGYDTGSAMTVEIVDTIVFNTSGGAYVTGAATLRVDHSLFFGMENGNLLAHGDREIELAQGAAALARYGAGNLVADPRLDEGFAPTAGSPAVDAGVVLPDDYPSRDRLGAPRVQGPAPDLGAVERAP